MPNRARGPNRPCWVEIDAQSLAHNFQTLACQAHRRRAAQPIAVLAIVKADAYGHGLGICAPVVVAAGARWLGVTSVEEGVAARQACAAARPGNAAIPGNAADQVPEILVISGPFPGQGVAAIQHGLTCVVWTEEQLDELESAGRALGVPPASVPIHLELDTGMSRQGAPIGSAQLQALVARLQGTTPLRLDGLMTHLYAADEGDGRANEEQFTRLEAALATLAALGADLAGLWLHVGNSALLTSGATGRLADLARRYGMRAMIRPGLALYGLQPRIQPHAANPGAQFSGEAAPAQLDLQPVLAWKTQIASLRAIASGDVVGYNATFVATEPLRLALLAVGYGDGLHRALSNRFHVLARGRRAPIVGRISMDQTVVDVTGIPDVAVGDEVVLIGSQAGDAISAYDHAEAVGTIPWEIFTAIGHRVERIVVESCVGASSPGDASSKC